MLEVKLTYSTDEGSEEIAFEGEQISFGRGSEADQKIDDDGLSRLHATIYREGEQFWIVDENSTNGSFVNGERVNPHGTALLDGDTIKIGNYTKIKISITEKQEEKEEEKKEEKATAVPASTAPVSAEKGAETAKSSFPMMLVTGLALFVIAASAIFIGVKVFGSGNGTDANYQTNEEFENLEAENGGDDGNPTPTKSPSVSSSTETPNNTGINNTQPEKTPLPQLPDNPNANKVLVTEGKKYQQLSDDEKKTYISVKAEQIAQIIGNQKSEPIPPKAVDSIKYWVDGYANRLKSARKDDCNQGSWVRSDFLSVLERATKTSPSVVRNFSTQKLEPVIGIYVAMIESEHCSCLTSKTGAVGMFQFLPRTAPDYGLAADQRCDPELSAKAAAIYLNTLLSFFGSAPDSVPLAIASYNSGQGHLRSNLGNVMTAQGGQDRSFWTLVENKDLMEGRAGEQFSSENKNYVPKFFATAIIGENPQDFGVNLRQLSLNR